MPKFTDLANIKIVWDNIINKESQYQLHIYNENRFIGCDLEKTPKLPKSNMPGFPFIVKSSNYAYFHCLNLKTVDYGRPVNFYGNMNGCFKDCIKLEYVGTEENFLDVENIETIVECFSGCTSLKSLFIKGLNKDLDISSSQVLERSSLIYLIDNSKSEVRKTIKVAWQLYDVWINDPVIQYAIGAHNVALAKN